MRRKRLLSCLLAMGVIFTSGNVTAAVSVKAAETLDAAVANESSTMTEKNLTNILSSVKQKINIPKEYTVFNYEYIEKSSYNDERWYFYWQNESAEGNISIASDKNANILNYFVSSYKQKNIPKYLKSELQGKAWEFINKVAGNISSKLQFTSSSYSGGYLNNYYYVYTRIENGVLMPQQQITVGINAVTGEVERFDGDSWNYEVQIPDKNIKVTKEQAVEKLREQITMNLKYKSSYSTDVKGNTAVKAYLVYEPSFSYLSVDAASGKLYTSLNQSDLYGSSRNKEDSSYNTASKESQSSNGGSLTEEEIKKISELEGLLSKQEAVNLVQKNSSLSIDPEAVITSASLTENSGTRGEAKHYYWNIQLSRTYADKETYYYSSYTRAVVDARTGEIVSFYVDGKDYYYYISNGEAIPNAKYSKAQSQKIFENFAKAQNKERFAETKLSNISNQYILDIKDKNEIYGAYSFNYNRMYDGIDFADNQIYGTVDTVTGKITSYGYYWNDSIVFEQAKNILSAKEAFDAYIQYDGFGLVYELNTIQTETSITQKARLVYQVNISPAFVSPFTGKQLNYNGSEYKNEVNSYQYTDIKGHIYERSIQLLTDLGAGFSEAKFNPDKAITKDELQKLAEAVTYMNSEYKLSGSSKVSRQEAAVYAVNILGLEKIAGIAGIYQTGAEDASGIKESYIGSVAIAKGLGILNLNDKNEFRPTDNLTRAEAADMLLKILGTDIN